MTKTPGYKGFGSTVSWGGTLIGYCRDIPEPNKTRDKFDLTNQDSPDETEEFGVAMKHSGDISFDMVHVPSNAGQAMLDTDYEAGTERELIITGPTGMSTTWTAQALITNLGGSLPYQDTVIQNVTFSLTGKVTLGVTYATGPSGLVVTGNVSGALTLSPAYAVGTYEYIADGSSEASVTVTVTAAGADTITVNGNTAASGVATGAITLTADVNTTITVKVGETGKATKTYTIRIIGPSS